MDRHVDLCPECGVRSVIYYTRNNYKGTRGDLIRRKRKCPICGLAYSTIELEEGEYLDLLTVSEGESALKKKIQEVLDGEEF